MKVGLRSFMNKQKFSKITQLKSLPVSIEPVSPTDSKIITKGDENIPAPLMGNVVDHLARTIATYPDKSLYDSTVETAEQLEAEKIMVHYRAIQVLLPDSFDMKAFESNVMTKVASSERVKHVHKVIRNLYSSIRASMNMGTPISDKAIHYVLELTEYIHGAFVNPDDFKDLSSLDVNKQTYNHIRMMASRFQQLFNLIGEPSQTGFSVQADTPIKILGEGDYLSANYILDSKVEVKKFSADEARQILLYYIIGTQQNKYPEMRTVRHLMLFNPRTNMALTMDVQDPVLQPAIVELKDKLTNFNTFNPKPRLSK